MVPETVSGASDFEQFYQVCCPGRRGTRLARSLSLSLYISLCDREIVKCLKYFREGERYDKMDEIFLNS